MKFKWVACGLNMTLDYAIIEIEGKDVHDSHDKAVELFTKEGLDWDTVEQFNEKFALEIAQ